MFSDDPYGFNVDLCLNQYPLQKAKEEIVKICEGSEGRSVAYLPGSPGYYDCIRNYFRTNVEIASLVVQPGSVEDLSNIMKVIAHRRVPFAVKCGGHIPLPGFSSTDGILISMGKFNQITFNPETETINVGAGLTWDQVYNKCSAIPEDRGCVGGDPRVGVSGWLLGGGYSLKTNEYGLGMDNVVGFQVVLPGGTYVDKVARQVEPMLFMALKGGGNNFGIVTQFTLKTFSRSVDHRTLLHYFKFADAHSEEVKVALANFTQHTSFREALVLATFRSELKKDHTVESRIDVGCLYDGLLFIDLFREFREIYRKQSGQANMASSGPLDFYESEHARPISLSDIHEVFARRYLPLSLEIPDGTEQHNLFSQLDKLFKRSDDIRGQMACIMVTKYTRKLIDAAEEQAKESAKSMKGHSGVRTSFEVWPIHPGAFNGIQSSDSAWPHEEGKVIGPLLGWYEWVGKENDDFWIGNLKNALQKLGEVARAEGCTLADVPIYLNHTFADTPVEHIYRNNYGLLQDLRCKYDPTNVMSCTGGFRIPATAA